MRLGYTHLPTFRLSVYADIMVPTHWPLATLETSRRRRSEMKREMERRRWERKEHSTLSDINIWPEKMISNCFGCREIDIGMILPPSLSLVLFFMDFGWCWVPSMRNVLQSNCIHVDKWSKSQPLLNSIMRNIWITRQSADFRWISFKS